jgi:hypothetical protein
LLLGILIKVKCVCFELQNVFVVQRISRKLLSCSVELNFFGSLSGEAEKWCTTE